MFGTHTLKAGETGQSQPVRMVWDIGGQTISKIHSFIQMDKQI
ncbi:MAG: hypothetical protein ACOZCO_12825 [Bacteroidota bacterium]